MQTQLLLLFYTTPAPNYWEPTATLSRVRAQEHGISQPMTRANVHLAFKYSKEQLLVGSSFSPHSYLTDPEQMLRKVSNVGS